MKSSPSARSWIAAGVRHELLTRALPALPPGTAYGVRRMDPTVFPIISYALLSERDAPVATGRLITE